MRDQLHSEKSIYAEEGGVDIQKSKLDWWWISY